MAQDEDIRRARQARELAKTLASQRATASSTPAVDPYYVRDPKTGLSPAQVEAQNALKEAQDTNVALGIPSRIVSTPGSAGSISTPPSTGLKTGYEWYTFNLPGGGFEWRQRPTKETLAGAYTTLFSGASGPTATGTTATGATATGPTGTVTTYTAPDGKIFTDLNSYNAYIAQLKADDKRRAGQSAYDLLFQQFNEYGLGALIEPLKGFIQEGLSQAEFTLRLRETDAYKKRFAANAQRIKAGLRALSEAEYITLEDQYQNVMRNYGLPASYYTRGDMGVQTGFEKFIAGDVSAAELEDRIQTAQNRVINAAPQVSQALRQFYPDITNGDILAYALDPDQALTSIKRKVGAAEIGAGALQAGLATGLSRAEELQRFGVTGEQARQGFATIAEFLPSATKLGDIYRKSGMGPYNQAVAEQEVFGITGAADAASKRKKLAQLETAQFSGQVGAAGSALGRERAGQF
jgi:hypothetical protein